MSKLKHGTPGAYNKGCKCDLCRDCNRLRMKARREYIRSRRKLIDGRWTTTVSIVVHGTTNAYENWQCRCLPCSQRHSRDMQVYQAQRKAKSNGKRRERQRGSNVTEKFRVGVVVILEVEAVDWTDAAAVAEGALKNAINEARNPHVPEHVTGQPVLTWVARNREVYEAVVVYAPVELSRALSNGYVHMAVQQPMEED